MGRRARRTPAASHSQRSLEHSYTRRLLIAMPAAHGRSRPPPIPPCAVEPSIFSTRWMARTRKRGANVRKMNYTKNVVSQTCVFLGLVLFRGEKTIHTFGLDSRTTHTETEARACPTPSEHTDTRKEETARKTTRVNRTSANL